MATLKNTSINDTGFFKLPVGTTAERPATPTTGSMRYNTTTSALEIHLSGRWQKFTISDYSILVDYLVVAGGGGGGAGYLSGALNGGSGGSGVVIIKIPDTVTATFTAGVTQTTSTSGGLKTITITATSNTSQTVTFN
jgi:hypothetical protein